MRRLAFALAASATAVTIPLAAGPSVRDPSPDLYVSAGCARCHGPTAAGEFGPALAATQVPFEDFLAQLRHPRWRMPAFSPDVISDEEARSLFEYVRSLEPAAAGVGDTGGCRCGPGRHGSSPSRGHGHGAGEACGHGGRRAPLGDAAGS